VLVKDQKDFVGGLLFTVVGGAFAYGASTYQVGDAARMGPGYFPLLLGIILALMGVVVVLQSLTGGKADGDPIGPVAWRPLLYVLGANVAFGALLVGLPSVGLPGFGLVVAIFALTFIASMAGNEFKLKEVLILAAILSVGSYLAFVKLLALQFPVWPAFITG
jgi:Tripartite tricarboxylate transporter TctB family